MIMHGGISDKGFCSFVVLKFSSVNAVKNVFNYFSTTQTPTLRWTLNVTDNWPILQVRVKVLVSRFFLIDFQSDGNSPQHITSKEGLSHLLQPDGFIHCYKFRLSLKSCSFRAPQTKHLEGKTDLRRVYCRSC